MRLLALWVILLLAGCAGQGGARLAPPILVSGGSYTPERQPDGNSIIFEGRHGLLVVDTGRHKEHQEQILALARARGKPISTIVNTHWHLDHTGGNQELRAVFPEARIVASNAVEGALAGFLAQSLADAEKALADPKIGAAEREEIMLGVDAVRDSKDLLPDRPVTSDGTLRLDERRIAVHLEPRSATAGDVWLYDEASRTVVAGDLVVLPAPFFDTACAEGWSMALARIAAVHFDRLVPGHGPALSRSQFDLYRSAFDALVACSTSPAPEEQCIRGWKRDAAPLLTGTSDGETAATLLHYYLTHVLRAPDKVLEYCGKELHPAQSR